MNSAEVAKLLAYLQVAYPNSKIEPSVPTIKLWSKHLADIPYLMAESVVDSMIDTSPFPPNIAHIREAYAKAMSEVRGDMTAGEAWREVVRVIHRHGSQQPTKARADLGERLWNAVELAGGWEQVCLGDPQIVTAQFERRYTAMAERDFERSKIAAPVHNNLQQLMGGMLKRIDAPREDN